MTGAAGKFGYPDFAVDFYVCDATTQRFLDRKLDVTNDNTTPATRERIAKAICAACDERPEHAGVAAGNRYRWQDYLPVADEAIAAIAAMTQANTRAVEWIPLAQREPTIADADIGGDVLFLRCGVGMRGRVALGIPVDATHWRHTGRN